MIIMAIDPATRCGWALSTGEFGVWDLSVRRDESEGMKWLRFRAKLEEVHKLQPLNVIAYERPAGQHRGALIHHAKLIAIIQLFCEESGIEYRGYSSTEIKKLATGKGNAGKQDVIAAAQKLGYTTTDDNEADAIWLLRLIANDLQVTL